MKKKTIISITLDCLIWLSILVSFILLIRKRYYEKICLEILTYDSLLLREFYENDSLKAQYKINIISFEIDGTEYYKNGEISSSGKYNLILQDE